MKKILFLLSATMLLLSSCGSIHDFSYFQDTMAGDVNHIANAAQAVQIKPYDKISIMVTCKDPQLSAIYNLVSSYNRLGQNSVSAGTGYVSFYTVDEQGDVDFPILGKIHVDGLTRTEVAETVKNKLTTAEQGVKDATVTVEFANLHVSVLGEVKSPGYISIDKDQFTLLDAIARAGDLTQYGNRKNVKVFRKSGSSQQTYEVDLTKFNEVCSSPVYMLQQDDIIYVDPNKVRARQSTATGNTLLTPSFWMSALSFAMSVAVFVTR